MTAVLVVSTGRTGTAAIANNFKRRYPESASLHEPFGSRVLRIAGNLYAAGRIGDRLAGAVVRTTYGVRRLRNRSRPFIECNPHACCLLPVICRLYPDTVVVHVVRNPVDFARSYVRHGAFSGLKGWLGHALPYWFLRPEHLANVDWPSWRKMSPMEASVWRWWILNRIIERDAERHASRHLRLRYEDLFSKEASGWADIASACGLDPEAWTAEAPIARVNASTAGTVPEGSDGTEPVSGLVRDRCAELMARYGYVL